jgi:hypothetical protein
MQDQAKVRVKRIMPIEFSCRFEMLKDPTGRHIGIRFEKEACRPYEMLTNDPVVLLSW